MTALLRVLLIAWLAVALPVQGVAAATMKFCAPAQQHQHQHQHQHRPAATSVQVDAGQHHGHGAAAAAPDAASADHGTGHPATGKCSACAACCMAAALPPAGMTLAAVEPVVEASRFTLDAYIAPDAAGLERPPKQALA